MLKKAQALFLRSLGATLALVYVGGANAESAASQLNMPQGVTEVSQAAYDIHMIMMWICKSCDSCRFTAPSHPKLPYLCSIKCLSTQSEAELAILILEVARVS